MSTFGDQFQRTSTTLQSVFGVAMTYKPYRSDDVPLTGRRRGEETREEDSNVGRQKVFIDFVEIRVVDVAAISLRDKVEIDGRLYDIIGYEDGDEVGTHRVHIKRYELIERAKQNLRRTTR